MITKESDDNKMDYGNLYLIFKTTFHDVFDKTNIHILRLRMRWSRLKVRNFACTFLRLRSQNPKFYAEIKMKCMKIRINAIKVLNVNIFFFSFRSELLQRKEESLHQELFYLKVSGNLKVPVICGK